MTTISQIDTITQAYGDTLTSLRMLRGLIGAVGSNVVMLPIGLLFVFLIAGESLSISFLFIFFLILMIFNLIIFAGAFNLLRRIWAGSITAGKTAISLISALNIIPIWLFSRGLNQVYTRPPLLFMELTGIIIIFLIFFLAVRGLLHSIKATELPCSSLLFSSLSSRNLKTDIYRIMGVPVTDNFPGKLPRKAFLFAVTAFLMEGSVFYTYFTLGVKLHKTAVRFRAYEIRHAETDLVGFGPVLLTFGAMLLTGFLSTQAFLYLARRFRLRSRRLLMKSYEEQKQTDPRPPFLFLRPFRDDQITLRDAPLRWYMRIFDPGVKALTLEELLVQTYADLGPIIAIGNPSDALPPIGASRQYVAENQWQEIVCSLMDNSQKIIVAVSDTQSVLWEIDTLVKHGHLAKTVFVFPPNDVYDQHLFEELLARIKPQKISIKGACLEIQKSREEQAIIALTCNATDNLFSVFAKNISELHYDVALRSAMMQ